ncbi:hypothetical protein BIU82_15625 [Arthrobacter sp. SW1]|uniref:WXG100 family type VII secretion target n=1 Tax=Arthrobacter sp. SW1 TaxID=1920889 RepID=UPI000877C78C|nr:hypothetical protein [Arthrobacter sp. SW1]OFI39073.1 hypothetical protein BIU82_15625 [Arthrobacter sp. SW1]
MAGFYGADVAQLRSLAGVMGKAADTIALQGTQLTQLINSTTAWKGQDASTFKNEWNGKHRQSIIKAASMLRSGASELKKHANQQEFTSHKSGESSVGVIKDVYDTASGVKDVAAQLWQAYKLGKLGWQEFAKTKEILTNWRAGGTVLREALDALRNGGKITDVISDLKANIPYSQAFQEASKFSKGLRIAGALAAPLNIVGGISDIINPQHDGWRGTGDRIAGGLSVVSGVGSIMLMTAGGAALLGPIGAPIVIGAGLVAGAWALGNLVADNWDSIKNFARNPGSYIADGAREVAGFAKDVGTKVADGVTNAAKSVGKFVGGIFG